MTQTAISLWDPWATLWAHGFKMNETRSWRHHKTEQWIMVHGGVKWDSRREAICDQQPFKVALDSVGFNPKAPRHGQILGLVKLLEPWRITKDLPMFTAPEPDENMDALTATERAFGDYEPGRWVWPTGERRVVLPNPVLCNGSQGFFRPNEGVVAAVRNSLVSMGLDPDAYGS